MRLFGWFGKNSCDEVLDYVALQRKEREKYLKIKSQLESGKKVIHLYKKAIKIALKLDNYTLYPRNKFYPHLDDCIPENRIDILIDAEISLERITRFIIEYQIELKTHPLATEEEKNMEIFKEYHSKTLAKYKSERERLKHTCVECKLAMRKASSQFTTDALMA